MQGCITWLLLAAGCVFVMITLIRWFEQTSDAVARKQWGRVALLVVMPLAVWRYPSRVAAGRPFPAPRHEPVRGMGTAPKAKGEVSSSQAATSPFAATDPAAPREETTAQPPPGTPPEFLAKPQVPPPRKTARAAVDPDKLAKLRQKMREQGMLPEGDEKMEEGG